MNNTKVSRVEATKVHTKIHFNFKTFLISSMCYMYFINIQLLCIILCKCKWFYNSIMKPFFSTLKVIE
jgi:hypothetical protein